VTEPAGSDRDGGGLAVGAAVIAIGVFLLLAQNVQDFGTWIPLLVGLLFLAAGVRRRAYGLLVAGGVISGVGVGVVLQQAVDDPWDGAISLLSLAAGFASIWVLGRLLRIPENHPWPLIPAAIIAIIAGLQLTEAELGGAIEWWPLIIIAIGLLIIMSALRRR